MHTIDLASPAWGVVAPSINYSAHRIDEGVIGHTSVHKIMQVLDVVPPSFVVALERLDPIEHARCRLNKEIVIGLERKFILQRGR